MELLVAFAVMGITNVLCFMVGAKVGMAVKKGENISLELPTANPIETFKTHKSKKVEQKERDRLDAIMQNIDCYDGTSIGQRDIPRR